MRFWRKLAKAVWRKRAKAVDPAALRELASYWVHDRHCEGRLLAAEVPDLESGCAVWDVETGEAVWDARATSICWSSDGRRVALLTDDYGERFELRSWPDRKLVSRCRVKPWACCNERVALSPTGDLAAVTWWHQSEGGVELVELRDRAARQLEERGYMTRETNLVEGPVFSPDGRYVVIAEGTRYWWSDDFGEPSPGGRRKRGRVTFVDVATGEARHVDVDGEVAAGWQPGEDDASEHFELLGRPQFVGDREVVVRPEFGAEQRLRLEP